MSGAKSPGRHLEASAMARLLASAGLGECSQLCDVWQMEHVCELLPDAFFAAQLGEKQGLTHGLRTLLIEPLYRFLPTLTVPARKGGIGRGRRMELAPTLELIEAAEEVIRRIESGPWDEQSAEAARHLLRYAWVSWIAYVASYWMSSEVPKLLVAKQVRREQGRLGGKASKAGTRRASANAEKIVELYEKLSKKLEPAQVAGAVAIQLSVTSTWVRRVWRRHSVAENVKRQASL